METYVYLYIPPIRCEILIGLDLGQCIFNPKYFQLYLELPTRKWEDIPSVQGRKYAGLTHYNFTLEFGLIDIEYHLPNDQIENERLGSIPAKTFAGNNEH